MNLHKLYGIILAVVLALAIGIGWMIVEHAKEDAIAQAKVQVLEQQNSQLGKQNQDLSKSIEQLKSETASQIASLEKQRTRIVTPAQALPVIHESTPLSSATIQTLPDAPSVLSQQDSLKLADFALQCKECYVKLSSLQQEDVKKDQIQQNTQAQLQATQKERDIWKSQAKGGSFLHKLKRGLKVIACATAGGAGGAALQGPKGAAIGSAAGAALCSLF